MCRLVREEITDEELCEDVDMSDDDEEEHKGAVGGARGKKLATYECPDSSLSPSARIQLYFNQSWRMEVRRLCGVVDPFCCCCSIAVVDFVVQNHHTK